MHCKATTGNAPRRGLCIEFVGIPGAGKSTVAECVVEELRAKGLVVTEASHVMASSGSPLKRLAVKMWLLIISCILLPREALSITLRTGQLTRYGRLGAWLTVSINLLAVKAVEKLHAKKGTIVVFDQGLLQGLWSIRLSAANDFDSTTLSRPPTISNRLIIFINSDQSLIRERLATRNGSSRLDNDSIYTLQDASAAITFVRCQIETWQTSGNFLAHTLNVSSNDSKDLADSVAQIIAQTLVLTS